MEKYFNSKILSFYTDGGGEFEKLKPYLNSQGIEHLVSPPYTPQRVAIVERRHRHLIETAKTLMHQASMPSNLWTFACHHATYLINRLPYPNTQNKSPYQLLFGDDPNYNSIRTFGCLCYPWLKTYTSNELESQSRPCVYIGFNSTYHCHQCLDPLSSKIFLSRDVQFFENKFPFEDIFSKLKNNLSSIQ